MDNVLIDTDIILDFFFDRKPFSEYATRVFSLCESKRIKGFVTPVICSNVYYLLRKTARHEKVVKNLNQLVTILDVLNMDKEIVLLALGSGFKDFEDAMQNFAAAKSGHIKVILTRDVKDFGKSDLGVLTPENYLKFMSISG